MRNVQSYTQIPMWVWALITVVLFSLTILYIEPEARRSLARMLLEGEPSIWRRFDHEGYQKGGPYIVRPPLY
jgi:hypothetical protein